MSMNEAIRARFPDPALAVEILCISSDTLGVMKAFQRDTINALADCLVRAAARLEQTNTHVTCEDLKREAQALNDYAETLDPGPPEVVHR